MYIPLEILGMVRACRPITPYVGLCRQSRDPERTKMYYQEARKIRDTVCFPSMLRQATKRCLGYRAIRRLWVQTLTKILDIPHFKYYIVKQILEYIEKEEVERIPLFYNRHYWKLEYTSLSPMIRMKQFAGKLHALGYSRMVIHEPDYELEGYLVLSKESYRHTLPLIPFLYNALKRKNILDKWPILSSHMLTYTQLSLKKEEWQKFCQENKLTLLLNACIRANPLTPTEIQLLTEWSRFMKYPSR